MGSSGSEKVSNGRPTQNMVYWEYRAGTEYFYLMYLVFYETLTLKDMNSIWSALSARASS